MLMQNSYGLIAVGLWIRTMLNTTQLSTKGWTLSGLLSLEKNIAENNLIVSLSYMKGGRYLNVIKEINNLESNETKLGNLSNKVGDIISTLESIVYAESTIKKTFLLPERRFNSEFLINDPSKLMKDGVFNKLDEIARHDITSACKCLLFGEATASAFHILRATESVLKDFYFVHRKQDRLKIPMWGQMVDQLRLKKANKPSATLLQSLDLIRSAYRNPTQHPEAIYEIDGAQDLFGLCFDVIGKMAIDLK